MIVVFSGLRVQSSYFNFGTVFFHSALSYSLSASLPSSSNKHYSFLITHFIDEKTEVWASSWDFPDHMVIQWLGPDLLISSPMLFPLCQLVGF